MFDLFLIRGLPSSGKTTFAHRLFDCDRHETDIFFGVGANYKFRPELIGVAHEWCQSRTRTSLHLSRNTVVSNTFTQRWEMQPYIDMAQRFDARLIVVDLFDGGCTDEELFERNKHGVPLETFAKMRARYEHDWRNGNPVSPWERPQTLAGIEA